MRIMVDTNVLVSLLIFSSKKMNQIMECIFMEHQLVLSSYIVEELKDVVRRKFPHKITVIDALLSKMSYEYVYTPDTINKTFWTTNVCRMKLKQNFNNFRKDALTF